MIDHNNFMEHWFREVWNNGREDVIDEMIHTDAIAHGLGEPSVGPDGFRSFYRSFRDQFADVNVTVNHCTIQDDCATALCSVTATDRKTNTPVRFTGTSMARLQDGKLIEGWNHFDFLTMYVQLGKIKPEQLA